MILFVKLSLVSRASQVIEPGAADREDETLDEPGPKLLDPVHAFFQIPVVPLHTGSCYKSPAAKTTADKAKPETTSPQFEPGVNIVLLAKVYGADDTKYDAKCDCTARESTPATETETVEVPNQAEERHPAL